MDVTFQIPDELVGSVAGTGDLPRRALEAFAMQELRAGRITEPQLCEMLGLARIQIDGFLNPTASSTITRWRTLSGSAPR